jgi:phosphatidylglycerol:prolipoprotein diacylglycerol transferase
VAYWTYPAIDPVALRLGPLAVRWYGLAYLACFLFAWWLLRRFNKQWKLGVSVDDESFIVLMAVVGTVLGGRLGYVLFYGGPGYWSDPIRIIQIWDGGMSFHGGLAGIMLAGVWVSRRLRIPFLTLCDIGAVAAPLGFGFGRLANFVNDELWGRVATVPWAMVFPSGGPLPRHPSQLYEAFLEGAVLIAVMLWLSRRQRPQGYLVGWLLILYGAFRIAVEFCREPDIQIGFLFGGITMGQLLSIPMVVAGVWLLLWIRRRAATPQAAKPHAAKAKT